MVSLHRHRSGACSHKEQGLSFLFLALACFVYLFCFVSCLFFFSSSICLLSQWVAVTTSKNKVGKKNLIYPGLGLGECMGLDFPWRLCQEGRGSGLVLGIKTDP